MCFFFHSFRRVNALHVSLLEVYASAFFACLPAAIWWQRLQLCNQITGNKVRFRRDAIAVYGWIDRWMVGWCTHLTFVDFDCFRVHL